MRPALSIVLPAYNEEENVERAVRTAAATAQALVEDYEVLVVDDGSRDSTARRLAGLQAELGSRLRVVRHPSNQGYGAALRDGFGAATGDLVFYTDSDNQFDLSELADFLPLMKEADVAVGYRRDRKDTLLRKMSSSVFNRLAALAFGLSLRDLNCSFKLFRREVLRDLTIESDDFFVDTEMMARIQGAGWRLVERGVRHLPRTSGQSSVRARDVPRTLLAIARMWVRLRGERRAALSAARP
ncbi:MAG TPA: glycosyltransferase family 2 protein [Vicinamibacteria bacterium]|nr:glycosyltransferase family 2 protein [Vicinamibacteria bacterium]